MCKIVFYEKPGCISNSKQKKWLKSNGCDLDERNLISHAWTEAKLLAFFNGLPVQAWFNQSAPEVKSGEINPDIVTAEEAINFMLNNPLLIRRPLMEIDNIKYVGFDQEKMSNLVGANEEKDQLVTEACSRTSKE